MSIQNPAPKKGVIFGTVATMVVTAAGVVAGVAFSDKGFDQTTTPVVMTVLGLIGSIIPSVLAYLKVDQVETKLENGLVERKVENAINKTLAPHLLATPANTTANEGEVTGDHG